MTRIGLICVFGLVVATPVITRVLHPTLLGDDVIRLVDLIDIPLPRLLFRPFGEHVAPGTEVVSQLTWQTIGHDIRKAPLGFCVASVLPWILLLLTFGVWLKRETGSQTAALVSVALVAQSPLALEAIWWYSASTFTWAILGIVVAILGASSLRIRPRWGFALIALGSGLGPSFSTIGILAAPLAIVRILSEPKTPRSRRILGITHAIVGYGVYLIACELGGAGHFRSIQQNKVGPLNPISGLAHALAVPGQILWPSLVGVRPSWTSHASPAWLSSALGLLMLGVMALLARLIRRPSNRRLVLLGAAMIYLGYWLTYSSRVCLVEQGKWTEPQLLYFLGGRYHVLPLLGVGAVLAAILASASRGRSWGERPMRSAAVGIVVGLLALALNRQEAGLWRWMLDQPDQKPTLRALHHVGELAQREGITRDQLARIFDPALRDWNGSVRNDRPEAFPLTKLVAQAPQTVGLQLPDEVARALLLSRLTPGQRQAIEAGACVSMNPPKPNAQERIVATGRLVSTKEFLELGQGLYRNQISPAYLEYEIDAPTNGRFLEFPGLSSDHDLAVTWTDDSGEWSPWRRVYWLTSPTPNGPAVIDVQRLAEWPAGRVARVRVKINQPGQLSLGGEPRLLR